MSALAGEMAAAPEPLDEDDVFRLAADVAADGDGEGAVELGRDLDQLLRTGLSDDTLDTLWQAVTGGCGLPAATGADTRDQLSRLAKRYPGPPESGTPAPERETTSRADVIAEVSAWAADPASGTDEPGTALPAALPAALTAIADHAGEDLAVRLLIRVLKTRRVLVPKERFDRLADFGGRFGHPGPLLYDELSVAWPPIDPARRDGEGDFGLSRLTSWFSWEWPEPTALDRLRVAVAADDATQAPGSVAAFVLVDVLRLEVTAVRRHARHPVARGHRPGPRPGPRRLRRPGVARDDRRRMPRTPRGGGSRLPARHTARRPGAPGRGAARGTGVGHRDR
ncbi:hypothetical protein ACFVQ4_15595 [Streptomyces laurentii]|uniref:hypothetical protein n=1 Tax=Streptomyces laurentii TaxID=39478 RepID=UPI003690A2B0